MQRITKIYIYSSANSSRKYTDLVVNHVKEGGKIRASSVLATIAGGRSEFEFFRISKIDRRLCFTG